MKDEFEVGDRVYELHDVAFVGRIVAISEYECYVAWHSDCATWVVFDNLIKVED